MLLGNGASRAISNDFRYSSLYYNAESKDREYPLLPEDKAIFESMMTTDFERALAALWTTEVVCKALGRNQTVSKVHERYESIQNALIGAVHGVHIPWSKLSGENVLNKIESALKQYKSVYSTNYDLLLYWAIMTENPKIFKDYFWSKMPGYSDIEYTMLSFDANVYFDITNTELNDGQSILYLH